jgi:hypothetical protein
LFFAEFVAFVNEKNNKDEKIRLYINDLKINHHSLVTMNDFTGTLEILIFNLMIDN